MFNTFSGRKEIQASGSRNEKVARGENVRLVPRIKERSGHGAYTRTKKKKIKQRKYSGSDTGQNARLREWTKWREVIATWNTKPGTSIRSHSKQKCQVDLLFFFVNAYNK